MKKILLCIVLLLAASAIPSKAEDGASLAINFQQEVDRRLDVPQVAQARYVELLEAALSKAEILISTAQYILVVDRNPHVQAIFLYWLDPHAPLHRYHFIGASPVSTGRPGEFDHFITPLGVFKKTLEYNDYRAEGTLNGYGIRGLGRKGMRVFDFGWVQAEQGWGPGRLNQMRLLLHATDPDKLEIYLGKVKSKGCVRIPTTLDNFIDRYGLLDADYEQALEISKKFWVLRPDRTPTPWSSRYLVIVDSDSYSRPEWSPEPVAVTKKPKSRKTPKQSSVHGSTNSAPTQESFGIKLRRVPAIEVGQ